MFPDLNKFQQEGAEQAATLWSQLSAAVPPFDPHDAFKAICTIKGAELLTRLKFSTPDDKFMPLLLAINTFVESTLTISGGAKTGSMDEGMRAIQALESAYPVAEEDFHSPAKFAVRQHTLDGMLLLAAVRFGKEQEVKDILQKLQDDFLHIIMGGDAAPAEA